MSYFHNYVPSIQEYTVNDILKFYLAMDEPQLDLYDLDHEKRHLGEFHGKYYELVQD